MGENKEKKYIKLKVPLDYEDKWLTEEATSQEIELVLKIGMENYKIMKEIVVTKEEIEKEYNKKMEEKLVEKDREMEEERKKHEGEMEMSKREKEKYSSVFQYLAENVGATYH